MFSNSLRAAFYTLHKRKGAARFIADCASWSFMMGVKLGRIPPPYDLTPLTVISHKYKFIYIGIPKVATRSFQDFFRSEAAKGFDIEIYETKKKYKESILKHSNYYRFSFTRDPLERILSCHSSKVGYETLSLLKRARIMSFYKGLYPGMPFDDFARWLHGDEGEDRCADRHWMSQYRFLHDENDNPICDFVGRYESLDKDVDKICKTLNLPAISLPKSGWISDTKPEVSPDARALIRQRYAKDYDLFGYED